MIEITIFDAIVGLILSCLMGAGVTAQCLGRMLTRLERDIDKLKTEIEKED